MDRQPGLARQVVVISRRNASVFAAAPGSSSGSEEFVRYFTPSIASTKRGATLSISIGRGLLVKFVFHPRPSASSAVCENGRSLLYFAMMRAFLRLRSLLAHSRVVMMDCACFASMMDRFFGL